MDHEIFHFLSQFAYQPLLVYGLVTLMLFASSFGLPIPEEVTILSVGFLAYAGSHPDQFPPPHGANGEPINVHTAAWVCFLGVLASDLLVYWLGRRYGNRMLETKFIKRILSDAVLLRTRNFAEKFGSLAAGVFRFTPALRFPGHFSCGMFGVPPWKFLTVDGLAALFSVPTQVYLIYYFGDQILTYLERFKITLIVTLVLCAVCYFAWKQLTKPKFQES